LLVFVHTIAHNILPVEPAKKIARKAGWR